MSALVNVEHSHVINAVTETTLVGTEDLADFEDNSQLFIIKSIEMRRKQAFQDLFSLIIRNNSR